MKKYLEARRQRTAKSFDSILKSNEAVVIHSGFPTTKPGGLDQTYDFLPHPDYFWLTDSRRFGGAVVYSPTEGWTDFITPVSEAEQLWEGADPQQPLSLFPARALKELPEFLAKKQVWPLGQAPEEAVRSTEFLEIQEALNRERRKKDAAEIELIRRAAACAARGYQVLSEIVRPGISERRLQLEYEFEVLKAGAEKFPYGTLVGSGINASILHAVPSEKLLEKGDLILIDAGADLRDYCVDITRMFYADGKPSSRQKSIYDLVLEAQRQAIAAATPGKEWHDVHRRAARVMAEGLKDLKILKGETDALLETGAIGVFFPHGVGHMVGQRVRDVGGDVTKPLRSTCGVTVRVDFPLEENFIMTVEPGIYFSAGLIDRSRRSQKFNDQIDWSEVEKWMDFGGVRIEDDILIRAQEPEVLTSLIPK